jgi:hypothetical protein
MKVFLLLFHSLLHCASAFSPSNSHAFLSSSFTLPLNQNLRQQQDSSTVKLNLSTASSDKLSLKPEETAFVFIEYQNEFTSQDGALFDAVKDCMAATKTLDNSKALLDAARNSGSTIIHVPIVFDEVSKGKRKFFKLVI